MGSDPYFFCIHFPSYKFRLVTKVSIPSSQLHHPFDPLRTSTIKKTLFLFLVTLTTVSLYFERKKISDDTANLVLRTAPVKDLTFGCLTDSSVLHQPNRTEVSCLGSPQPTFNSMNFGFFEMVSLVWKSGSRLVQCFRKVNGCDFDVYCPLFPVVLNFHI